MYLMITVLSDTRRLKAILKALKNMGIEGSVVLDSMGTNSLQNSYSDYKPFLESSLIAISEKTRYKKTIISTVTDDTMVEQAMDNIQEILGHDLKKPRLGMMFVLPVTHMRGGELERHIESRDRKRREQQLREGE